MDVFHAINGLNHRLGVGPDYELCFSKTVDSCYQGFCIEFIVIHFWKLNFHKDGSYHLIDRSDVKNYRATSIFAKLFEKTEERKVSLLLNNVFIDEQHGSKEEIDCKEFTCL